MNQHATYLASIRRQQEIEKELEEIREPMETLTKKLLDIYKVKDWLVSRNLHVHTEIEEEITMLQSQIGELETIVYSLIPQWNRLSEETNMSNLRHVVHCLYTEQGFTVEQFANQIHCHPDEILDLTSYGFVTEDLLDRICNYFNIAKTKKFIRYIHNSQL